MKTRLARTLLRASGLPSLNPIVASVGSEPRASAAVDALIEHGEVSASCSLTPLLRWMAQERGLLFHGSRRSDIDMLEPIRLTTDTTTFGNQEAVFATSDPVWAIYFATLDRSDGFTSTRNGSIGLVGSLYPRWYFFSHNVGASGSDRFGRGWLYVLPRDGFQEQPPVLGVLDSAQWASPSAATPIARIPVGPEAFPFADWVVPHRLDERILTTLVNAARTGRRIRRARTNGKVSGAGRRSGRA